MVFSEIGIQVMPVCVVAVLFFHNTKCIGITDHITEHKKFVASFVAGIIYRIVLVIENVKGRMTCNLRVKKVKNFVRNQSLTIRNRKNSNTYRTKCLALFQHCSIGFRSIFKTMDIDAEKQKSWISIIICQ